MEPKIFAFQVLDQIYQPDVQDIAFWIEFTVEILGWFFSENFRPIHTNNIRKILLNI